MILVRIILISLIVYLIIRSFVRSLETRRPETHKPEPDSRSNSGNKKVSKEIGEYIDYEELDKRSNQN